MVKIKVLVRKDASGAFQKAKIEIEDPADLKILNYAIEEYIEWMESFNFHSGDEEERGMLSAALKAKSDLKNEIDWNVKRTVEG